MFIISKNKWYGMAVCALVAALFSFPSFTPANEVAEACNCAAPANATATAQDPGTAVLDWSAVAGATAYEVWYVRETDGFTSAKTTISATQYTYTGLQAGRHSFHIRAICGTTVSGIVILEEVIIA